MSEKLEIVFFFFLKAEKSPYDPPDQGSESLRTYPQKKEKKCSGLLR